MNLKEALEQSGVSNTFARPEIPAYRRWWQNFRLSFTVHEIPVFLKVQCDKWEDGLRFIRGHNLNYITTRCKTEEEARDQLRRKITDWDAEDTLLEGEEPKQGALLYWRLY